MRIADTAASLTVANGKPPSVVETAIWAVPRGEAPQLIHSALEAGEISFGALRPHLATLWQSADFPCRRLAHHSIWLSWFTRAALKMPTLPETPIRAWRAHVGTEPGLSWTTERTVAERFHAVNVARRYPDPRILQAEIPPSGIVFRIDDPESELIVDPACLGDSLPWLAAPTPEPSAPEETRAQRLTRQLMAELSERTE